MVDVGTYFIGTYFIGTYFIGTYFIGTYFIGKTPMKPGIMKMLQPLPVLQNGECVSTTPS